MQWSKAVLAALALAEVAACGRLDFEPRTDATTATPIDAAACIADFFVDSDADDAVQSLNCTGSGCSLRAAIGLANGLGMATICVADGLSIEARTVLGITGDVTILGSSTSICGTGTDRVFHVLPTGALRLRDLTVCHGRVTGASGAGVLVDSGGTLDADRVLFTDNVVVAESDEVEGGAVHVVGNVKLTIRRSRFTNNHVSGIRNSSRGGALSIRSPGIDAAQILVEDTAFEDNSAAFVGGALYLRLDGGSGQFERLLFARNSAIFGSAIDINCASTGTLRFGSSTFADNGSSTGGSSSVIYVCGNTTALFSFTSFRGNVSDLVELNTDQSRVEWHASALDVGSFELCNGQGQGSSLGYNIASRTSAICLLNGASDQIANPGLAPLANNGGLTDTLALIPGSPAIDGAGASCPALDQRGQPRPRGAACDVGALESD